MEIMSLEEGMPFSDLHKTTLYGLALASVRLTTGVQGEAFVSPHP